MQYDSSKKYGKSSHLPNPFQTLLRPVITLAASWSRMISQLKWKTKCWKLNYKIIGTVMKNALTEQLHASPIRSPNFWRRNWRSTSWGKNESPRERDVQKPLRLHCYRALVIIDKYTLPFMSEGGVSPINSCIADEYFVTAASIFSRMSNPIILSNSRRICKLFYELCYSLLLLWYRIFEQHIRIMTIQKMIEKLDPMSWKLYHQYSVQENHRKEEQELKWQNWMQ